MIASFIKPLQNNGGIYVFNSAINDLNKAIFNNTYNFKFKYFVGLNIPDFRVPSNSNDNTIQINTIDGAILSTNGNFSSDYNINLAEAFQNYVLNMESLILDNITNPGTIHSPAERIFFKWLKETGAIRFTTANESNYFVENNHSAYKRIVQYIGEIEAINIVNKNDESYVEVYMHIPSEDGNTPYVLFKTTSDGYYHPGMVISNNSEYILNRNISETHPYGLRFNAFYDYDTSVLYTDPNANWFNNNITNSYYTEPVNFNDPTDVLITKTYTDYGLTNPTTVQYMRSKLDGIGIEFDIFQYNLAKQYNINDFHSFNSFNGGPEFEINAVAIYYEFSDGNETVINLYGILFLDKVTNILTSSGNGGYISRFKKYKANTISGLNGNSYGLKLNIKYTTSSNEGNAVSIINDYNTFSFGLFLEMLQKLGESNNILLDNARQYPIFLNRLQNLENLYNDILKSNFIDKINNLENIIKNNFAQLASNNALIEIVNNLNNQLTDLMNNKLPQEIAYNTDVIKAGDGIFLEKSNGYLYINNNNYGYALPINYNDAAYTSINSSTNPLNLNVTQPMLFSVLKKYNNIIYIYTVNSANGNLKIILDDRNIDYISGLAYKIIFKTPLQLNGNNILFYTDYYNRKNMGILNYMIGSLSSNDLLNNKPIIEVVCIDGNNLLFNIDIHR